MIQRLLASLAVAFALSSPAFALNLGAAVPSWDGAIHVTAYPDGDRPIIPCDFPAGWTELAKGTGAGEICENSATEFDMSVIGTTDEGNIFGAYQSCGIGDCEVIARIPAAAEWVGHQETFTSFIVGISEGTGDADWYFHAWATPDGRVRCKAGTPGPDDYVESGPANQLPEYIAVTRDASLDDYGCWQSDDAVVWTRYGTFSREAAVSSIGYVAGTSHEPTLATTAIIEGIDFNLLLSIYTPETPPVGTPPVQTSTISPQSGTSGTAFSLNISGSFTGETSYTATPLASGTGLSFSTGTGILSGTPAAGDVTASPYNVPMCAVNADGATCQTVSFDFSAPSGGGNTILWESTDPNSRTCAQLGAVPGDTVIIKGDAGDNSRPNLTITNCTGTANSPIRFVNDVTRNGPLLIDGSSTFGVILDSLEYVIIDGLGGWNGAPATGCGNYARADMMQPPSTTQTCGIKLTGGFQSGVKGRGPTRFTTIQGVSCEGGDSLRSCFAMNDHQYPLDGVTQLQCVNGTAAQKAACEWREGMRLLYNFANNQHTECFYVGSNANTTQITDLPLRNNEMAYNFCYRSGWDALSFKSVIDDSTGRTSVHHNYVDIAGESPEPAADGNAAACIAVFESGFVDVYSNVCRGAVRNGISVNTQNRPSTFDLGVIRLWNNVVIGSGGRGLNVGSRESGDASLAVEAWNNTFVETDGVSVGSPNTSCILRDNVLAGTSGQQTISGSGVCTPSGNSAGTVAFHAFENSAGDNYRLTSSSPARNAGATNCPADDFEGDARPQQTICDKGADEYAP